MLDPQGSEIPSLHKPLRFRSKAQQHEQRVYCLEDYSKLETAFATMSLHVKVISAANLKDVDAGWGKSDNYLVMHCAGSTQQTKVVHESLDPEWNEEFDFDVSDPSGTVVTFMCWDSDGGIAEVNRDEFVGSVTVSLNSLRKGEPTEMNLQLMRNSKQRFGALNVELTANEFSGLAGDLEKLEAETQKLGEVNSLLTAQVGELEENVGRLEEANGEYDRLNGELKDTVASFDALRESFEENAKTLQEEVGSLKETNAEYERLNGEMKKSLGKLEEANGEYERLNGELTTNVGMFTEQNATLEENSNALAKEVYELREANAEYERLNGELKENVASFTEQNEQFSEQNKKLEEAVGDLTTVKAKLGNKVELLSTEVTSLQKTREMLDAQVTRQKEQNEAFKKELGKLETIEAGMKEFADQQGEDYATFVEQLTSNIQRNAELLDQFAAENELLTENRRKQRVESLVALSNSFQFFDHEAGLSAEEFTVFLDTLGPELRGIFEEKIGANDENTFGKLDTDNSGTLNVGELRAVVDEMVGAAQ